MAVQVNIHEAKTHLSKLLLRVQAGEEIVIAKAGVPVARLVGIAKAVGRRMPGTAKGSLTIQASFDESLPDDVLESFEK